MFQEKNGEGTHLQRESPHEVRGYDFSLMQDRNQAAAECEALLPEEAAQQLIFVLQGLLGEDFVNHCNEAVEELAKRLFISYGGESSFFEEVPEWKIFDARARGSLDRASWNGVFHSVAVLYGPQKQHKDSSGYIIIDLNAQYVHKKIKQGMGIFVERGSTHDALRKLADMYGGKWKLEFSFQSGKKKWIGESSAHE